MFDFAQHFRSISGTRALPFLIVLLAVCANNVLLAHAEAETSALPDAVLRHVLYTEPNLHILQLGNAS